MRKGIRFEALRIKKLPSTSYQSFIHEKKLFLALHKDSVWSRVLVELRGRGHYF